MNSCIRTLPVLFVASVVGCGGGSSTVPAIIFRANSSATPAEEKTTSPSDSGTPVVAGIGSLKGRVLLTGDFSPLKPLFEKGSEVKDKAVCGLETIPNQKIVSKEGGLANVFIYLDKAPKGAPPSSAAGDVAVIFDQKFCVFKPHALVARVGQTVKILNSDGVAHNTHTNPRKNPGLNETVAPNNTEGVPLKYKLAEGEPFSVVCDVHSWMVAYHLPLDHAFAAVTNDDGSFEIPNLPTGSHEFKIWHEAGKFLEKKWVVEIKKDETTTKDYSVSLGKLQ